MAEYNEYNKYTLEVSNGNTTTSITNDNDETKIPNIGTFKIQSFVFRRRMYEPCSLEITLNGTIDESSNRQDLVEGVEKEFKNSNPVKFYCGDKKNGVCLASNYRIFNVNIAFSKDDNNTGITIKLILFSPDKYLTLDNSCMAYTGRKLGENIFEGENIKKDENLLRKEKDEKEDENKNVIGWGSIKTLADYLPSGVNMSKKKCLRNIVYIDSNKNEQELRQPYLVQYNESFYNFLARSANRCGEFLYYENESFILGLDNDGYTAGQPNECGNCYRNKKCQAKDNSNKDDCQNKKQFTNFVEIEASKCIVCRHKKIASEGLPNDKINYFAYNYLDNNNEKKRKSLVSQSFIFDDLQDTDEYLNSVEYQSWTLLHVPSFSANIYEEIPTQGAKILGGLGFFRAAVTPFLSSFLTFSAFVGINAVVGSILSALGIFLELFFGEGKRLTRHNVNVLRPYKLEDNKLSDQVSMDDKKEVVYQFATPNKNIKESKKWEPFADQQMSAAIGTENLTSAYYNLIKKAEEEVERNMFTIRMNASNIKDELNNIRLGYIVKYNEEYYLIVDIQHSYSREKIEGKDKKTVTEEETVTDEINVTMIPLMKSSGLNAAIPFRLEDNIIRESNPMYGSVAFEYDPNFIGRVRVYFDWQKNDSSWFGDATPWIRVVTPLATKSGMMRLTPQVGDHAIIDFENGNIEKPFVIGYKSDVEDGDRKNLKYLENGILTREGRGIIFNDTNVKCSFLKNTINPFTPLSVFLNTKVDEDKKNDDEDKYYGGDISIQDFRGLCSIKASTDKRQIDINSPFGSVTLNSFTGIEISAPNGDVEIMGKNVDITASCKVNIKSGTNLFPFYWGTKMFSKYFNKEKVSNMLYNFANHIVDIDFVRAFYGLLFRPVEGDLTVSANRNVIMEAGRGFVPYGVTQKDADLWGNYSILKKEISDYLNTVKVNIGDLGWEDVKQIDMTGDTLDDMRKKFKKMPFKINESTIEDFVEKGSGFALDCLITRKVEFIPLLDNLVAGSKVAGDVASLFIKTSHIKKENFKSDIIMSTGLGSVCKLGKQANNQSGALKLDTSGADISGTAKLVSDNVLFLEDIVYDFKMFLMKCRGVVQQNVNNVPGAQNQEGNDINIIGNEINNMAQNNGDQKISKLALRKCLYDMCKEI